MIKAPILVEPAIEGAITRPYEGRIAIHQLFGDNAQGREQPDTLDALAIHGGQACRAIAIFGPDRFDVPAGDAEIRGAMILNTSSNAPGFATRSKVGSMIMRSKRSPIRRRRLPASFVNQRKPRSRQAGSIYRVNASWGS